jgi:antitoxin MazE
MIYISAQCISVENVVKISKWGNSLAIRIPADVAASLGFAEGDQVKIESKGGKLIAAKKFTREELRARLEEVRKSLVWPADYRFNREEIYEERLSKWPKNG